MSMHNLTQDNKAGFVPTIEKPVCSYCGSDQFAIDANATWDADEQDWVLAGTYDEGICRDCGEEGYPNWIPVENTK